MTYTRIQSEANATLEALNCPSTPARIEIVAKQLAEIDGDVRVADADGDVRMLGNDPMTIVELVREILQDRDGADARTLRWKPFGAPV